MAPAGEGCAFRPNCDRSLTTRQAALSTIVSITTAFPNIHTEGLFMKETAAQQLDKAMAQGRRVQEAVQQITLKTLAQGRLDLEPMRKVTADAVHAVREAAAHQHAHARDAAKQAAQGIQRALAQAAEALKLSIQEASGRRQLSESAERRQKP